MSAIVLHLSRSTSVTAGLGLVVGLLALLVLAGVGLWGLLRYLRRPRIRRAILLRRRKRMRPLIRGYSGGQSKQGGPKPLVVSRLDEANQDTIPPFGPDQQALAAYLARTLRQRNGEDR